MYIKFIYITIFVIYLVLSGIIAHHTIKEFTKRINYAKTIKESQAIRTRFSIYRILIGLFVIVLGFIIILVILNGFRITSNYINTLLFSGMFGLVLMTLSNLSLPISLLSFKEFKERKSQKPFVLYLRGFITDNYTPYSTNETIEMLFHPFSHINIITKKNIAELEQRKFGHETRPLSAIDLIKAWKKFYPVYGVGNPNELMSPEGCKTIFLDNSEWKENVLFLMEKAEYIIIRVHPNENCIWEIQKSKDLHKNKTIYYIEDIDMLESIKNEYNDKLPECLKVMDIVWNHMYAHQLNGEIMVKSYHNDFCGFLENVNDITSQINDNGNPTTQGA